MTRYISHVGKLSVFYSNMSGQTDCNLFDVIYALDEIESVQGFTDQSDPNHRLSSSGVIVDLYRFETEREAPFAHSITRFPVVHSRKVETFQDAGNEIVGGHIPGCCRLFLTQQLTLTLLLVMEVLYPSNKGKGLILASENYFL